MAEASRAARRVLVLTNTYPPHAMGGYELLCQDHVRWLVGQGDRVTVVTTTFGVDGPAREIGEAGEEVWRALDLHWRDFEHARPSGVRLVRGERRQRRVMEDVLEGLSPDLAFVWGMATVSKAPLEVVARRGVAIVAVVEEHWPLWDIEGDAWLTVGRRLPRIPPLQRAVEALVAPTSVARALDVIVPVCCSRHLAEEIEGGRPEWRGRVHTVLNGIDLGTFTAEGREPQAGGTLRLLYAGRVERRKGLHTVLDALPLLREAGVDVVLTVAGWGDAAYVSELRAGLDADSASRVRWLGPVPRPSMPQLYRDHDILVFPSVWHEPFGLVALEAMACGCVVVATGRGGMAEFLEDDLNALLFPAEDAESLARAVTRLGREPAKVDALRARGYQTAAEHGLDVFADGLELCAEEALGRQAG